MRRGKLKGLAGSLVALASLLASLMCLAIYPVGSGLTFIWIGMSLGLAIWWRARPVWLLFAIIAAVAVMLYHPSGLHSWLNNAFGLSFPLLIDASLAGQVLRYGVFLGTSVLVFMLAALRQSGGIPLSAQEASEDIGRTLNCVGMIAALLFLPMLALVAIEALKRVHLLQSPQGHVGNHNAFWQLLPGLSDLMVFLVLGALAFAIMRDVTHRLDGWRASWNAQKRAVLELLGACIIMLPIAWSFAEIGWRDVAPRLAKSPQPVTSVVQTSSLALVGSSVVTSKALQVAPNPHAAQSYQSERYHLYRAALRGLLPLAFLLIAASAIAIAMRSLVFLYGPPYLRKRASSHLALCPLKQEQAAWQQDIGRQS